LPDRGGDRYLLAPSTSAALVEPGSTPTEVLVYDIPAGTILFRQQAADTKRSLLNSLMAGRRSVTPKDRMAGRLFPIPQVIPGDQWTVFRFFCTSDGRPQANTVSSS
jgi:hypothetical protein